MGASLLSQAALAAPESSSAANRINKPMLAQAGDAVAAQWVTRKSNFMYQGVTARYTCNGLREQLRDALRKLGARRSDLKIRDTGCAGGPDQPSPFPGANIEMSVLVPAQGASAGGAVQAHWHPVNLKLNDRLRNDPGSCELIEEITKKIVPLFTTRNLQSRATCVPHQLSPAQEPVLKLEVLSIDPEAAKG